MRYIYRFFFCTFVCFSTSVFSMGSILENISGLISRDLRKRPSCGLYIPKEDSEKYVLMTINTRQKAVEDKGVSCFSVDNSCCGVGKPIIAVPTMIPVRCCFYEKSIKDACIINFLVCCCQK